MDGLSELLESVVRKAVAAQIDASMKLAVKEALRDAELERLRQHAQLVVLANNDESRFEVHVQVCLSKALLFALRDVSEIEQLVMRKVSEGLLRSEVKPILRGSRGG